MRHYVVQKKNQNPLPHNLYMQMLYLIRDYAETGINSHGADGETRQRQWDAVLRTKVRMEKEYKKRPGRTEALDSLRGFFDYPYFSSLFMQKGRELGASRRSWNLYRCRFAYLVAKELGFIECASDSRHDG